VYRKGFLAIQIFSFAGEVSYTSRDFRSCTNMQESLLSYSERLYTGEVLTCPEFLDFRRRFLAIQRLGSRESFFAIQRVGSQ
jgi:hypothetical protein